MKPRDEGSIAPAVPVLALVLLLLAGLVVDASRQLTERGRAVAYAEEAARAGAAAIELDAPDLELLPDEQVAARVNAYCGAAAAAGAPLVDPGNCFRGTTRTGDPQARRIVVQTHVELVQPTTLLGIVGVRELRASGDGRARPFEGTREEDAS
ncbi:pilus assembly protein TadG-related protein [Kineococcus rhizosphaerae]|uniref:Putative Flp pilus-assembly TadE/G-like protein n=1 Tax=Kineococcus rhizosphaerae TaxID=559628 RepID=A0A2T0R9F4_9ACTN|nr:pilus assembly protein TadG-related protein [Kineococcus rhizosphaerae]PRY17795.1 putative Flp pilus-assembly TadE/G-like protein [Kineococcus rhizosphaerae]